MKPQRLFNILTHASQYMFMLRDFERDLVNDRLAAYRQYGLRTRITPKQEVVLEEIAQKLFVRD